VVALDKELWGHTHILAGQFQKLGMLIVLAQAEVDGGDVAFPCSLRTDNAGDIGSEGAGHFFGHLTVAGGFMLTVCGSAVHLYYLNIDYNRIIAGLGFIVKYWIITILA
jgi:hypothetical protein